MGWQRFLKVRGLIFGLVTLQALGMTRGEGLVSDKDLESRAEWGSWEERCWRTMWVFEIGLWRTVEDWRRRGSLETKYNGHLMVDLCVRLH